MIFLLNFDNSMSRRATENVCNSESIQVRLHCPFVNCEKCYKSRKHLNEHFHWHPSHKPDTLPSTRVHVTAKECAEKSLDEANPYTRKLRAKELFQLQTDDELKRFACPRVANIVTLAEFWLQGTLNKDQVHQKLVELKMNFAYTTQNLTLSVSKNHHLLIKENNLLKSFRVICHIHVIRLLRWAMVQYSKILLCLKSSERNILDSKNFLVE